MACCSHCGSRDEKLLRCSSCRQRRYCSKECQTAAWRSGHKQECARLQSDMILNRDREPAEKAANRKLMGKALKETMKTLMNDGLCKSGDMKAALRGLMARLDHPNKAISKAALRVLRDFTFDEDDRLPVTKTPGVPGKLFAMLRSSDPFFVEHAAGTLCNVACDDEGLSGRKNNLLAVSGALEAVADLIESPWAGADKAGPTVANDAIAEVVLALVASLGTESHTKRFFSLRPESLKRIAALAMDGNVDSHEGLGVVMAAVLCLRNLASFWTRPDENTIRTCNQLAQVPGFVDRLDRLTAKCVDRTTGDDRLFDLLDNARVLKRHLLGCCPI